MTNISEGMIYQIEISLLDIDLNRLLWDRLKYYYNHGALEFNNKIIQECKLSDNKNLVPYHFKIGTFIKSTYLETQISTNFNEKIIFDILGEWTYEDLFDILNAMKIVFSDYVGSDISCKLTLRVK